MNILERNMDYINTRCGYFNGLYKIKKQDQEDIFQAICIKILELKKTELNYEQAYLNTLINNTYKDHLKQVKRSNQCANIDDYNNDIALSYEDDHNHSLIINAIDDFKKTLSEVDANVLSMYLEDYTAKEIAEELDLTQSAVWKKIERIKKKMSGITAVKR